MEECAGRGLWGGAWSVRAQGRPSSLHHHMVTDLEALFWVFRWLHCTAMMD